MEGRAATGLTHAEHRGVLPPATQWLRRAFLAACTSTLVYGMLLKNGQIHITPFWRFVICISILNVLKSPVLKNLLKCVETGCPEFIVNGMLFFL